MKLPVHIITFFRISSGKPVLFYVLRFSMVTWMFWAVISCKDEPNKVVKKAEVAFQKEGGMTLYNAGTDSIMATLDIEIAESEYETQTGLMYRQGMEDHQGMLFIFPEAAMHSFYMKNTEFPLDIVFFKADSTVATIHENTRPRDEAGLSSEVPVQYVLEVNAGLAEAWGLSPGDRMAFQKD